MKFILLLSFLLGCCAYSGVDVSSLVSTDSWQCMASSGYTFAVIRGYRSSGSVDPNTLSTIDNAWKGGMKYVDVYLFPCPTCSKSATDQVDELVNYLSGSQYGMIWLDIEGTQYWTSNTSSNVDFITGLVDQVYMMDFSSRFYSVYHPLN